MNLQQIEENRMFFAHFRELPTTVINDLFDIAEAAAKAADIPVDSSYEAPKAKPKRATKAIPGFDEQVTE